MTDTKPTSGLTGPSLASQPSRRLFAVRRMVAGVLGVALLVAASGLARAQEEEKKDEWLDQKLFRNFLGGLGLTDDSANINYHERSPLVIPPGANNLPPPESSAAVRQNPSWPNDPDRNKAKQAKKRDAVTQGYWDDEAKPLKPDQLNRSSGGPIRTTRDGPTVEESGRPVKPSELGYKGGVFSSLFGYKEEVVPFTGEPARESLIEPPKGYRTPSAAQPYGIMGKEEPKKYDPKDRGLATSSR